MNINNIDPKKLSGLIGAVSKISAGNKQSQACGKDDEHSAGKGSLSKAFGRKIRGNSYG